MSSKCDHVWIVHKYKYCPCPCNFAIQTYRTQTLENNFVWRPSAGLFPIPRMTFVKPLCHSLSIARLKASSVANGVAAGLLLQFKLDLSRVEG